MKFTYYANCVPGMQGITEKLVKSCLKDAVIKKNLEGALIFETACPRDRLNFHCFNNIFAVLDLLEGRGGEDPLLPHIKKICRQNKVYPPGGKARSFRVIYSRSNRLAGVGEGIKRDVEAAVSRKTGLIPDRGNPGREYWFLSRSEGFSLFMERITRHKSFDKSLHPGELSPPLAYLLCWMAAPEPESVVLDPFCGYGSIPAQGIGHFPLKKFYAFDIRAEAVEFSRNKIRAPPGICTVQKQDMRNLPSVLPGGSVDRIITDPPWGLFEQLKVPLDQFYGEMARIFYRLLKDQGIIVLLTAGKDEFTAAVSKTPGLEICDLVHVLVSGKKAGIFTVRKTETLSRTGG